MLKLIVRKFLILLSVLFTFSQFLLCQATISNEKLDSLAFAYFENSEFDKAEKTAQELLNVNSLDTNIYRVNANTLLGILNKNRGYYISATEHYISALNDARALNDKGRQSAILNNLGTLYKLQHNYQSAIDYFKMSLELGKDQDNQGQASIRFYNIADAYLELDSLDLALSFFNNSLLLEQEIENKIGLIYAYMGITDVYIKMGNEFQSALMIERIEELSPFENAELEILFEFVKAKQAFISKDYNEAKKSIEESIKLVQQSGISYIEPDILKFRIKVFKEIGSYKELSIAYQEYLDVSETRNSQMIRNEIYDLNYQNELNKKQLELESLRAERQRLNKAKEKDLQVRKFQQRLILFILGLLVLSVVLVFLGVRKMKTMNKT